jgi:hypothetical protein
MIINLIAFMPFIVNNGWAYIQTVPLLGKSAFKKYLPAAIFICTITKAVDIFGDKKKWWKSYKGIPSLNSLNFLNFGPYFVTSLWVLKMTYGKFPLYLISNTIFQSLFIFLGLKYVKDFKIFSLEKLTKFQYLAIDFLRALLLYGFQYITEATHTKKSIFNKRWIR